MLCTDPRKVKVTSYKKVATTSGIGLVPCGQCLNCRVNQARIWTNRIILEACEWADTTFATLTFDDQHLPDPPLVKVTELQKFLKRYRYHSEKRFKYFGVGEYGDETGRPHYHVIMFGVHAATQWKNIAKSWCDDQYKLRCEPERLQTVDLTPALARYCAGYVTKKAKDDKNRWEYESQKNLYLEGKREFALMSKGLGKTSVEKLKPVCEKWEHELTMIRTGGKKYPLGRYLKSVATPKKDWVNETLKFRAGQERAFRDRLKASPRKAKIKSNRRTL